MTNPITASARWVGRGVKAAAIRAGMIFSGGQAGWWSRLLLPRTRFDYSREVDAASNSITMACTLWVCRTFPEAPFVVFQEDDQGKREIIRRHKLAYRIEHPNQFYAGPLLWWATLADYVTDGNAYWIKVRSAIGEVTELWYTPQRLIEPRWPEDGSKFIDHYDYTPIPGQKPIELAVEDVVHFRYGVDGANIRKGHSPLKSLLREIFTDDESANFTAALLKNLGIPGLIIAPDGTELDEETAAQIRDTADQRYGGDKRGSTMVMLGPTKVTTVGFTPQQMNLKELRRIPEERVSAVLGVPAIVAGLGAGLDRSTFANMAEARELAFEGGIIPMQRLLAAEIAIQLLPDFDAEVSHIPGFDTTQVRVLQDDQDKLYTRVNTAVTGGWMSVAEAKTAVGLTVEDGDDIYLRSGAITPVKVGTPAPDPNAEPTPATVTEVPPEQLPPGPPSDQATAVADQAAKILTEALQRTPMPA